MNIADERLPQAPAEMQATLAELRQRAGLLTLPGLVLIGLALAMCANAFPDPLQPALFGTLLILLATIVWACRQASEGLSVRILAIGGPLLAFLGVTALRLEVLLYVLPVIVGISALALNPTESAAIAGLSSWLLVVITSPESDAFPKQLILLVAIWGTVALIWLAKHSLRTTVAWAWSSHLHSQLLLQRARGYQVQLKQALADLADANIQLTHLNQLADNARRAAEDLDPELVGLDANPGEAAASGAGLHQGLHFTFFDDRQIKHECLLQLGGGIAHEHAFYHAVATEFLRQQPVVETRAPGVSAPQPVAESDG